MTKDVSVFVRCDTIFRLFFCGNYHKFELLTFARYRHKATPLRSVAL